MPTLRHLPADLERKIIESGGLITTCRPVEMDMRRPVQLVDETEAEFTRRVIGFAQMMGWRVAHFRPGRTKEGWRTAVSGDGKGFPDLLMIRGPELIVAELKVGKNKPTPEQRQWLGWFAGANIKSYIWYPSEWPEIEALLVVKKRSS